MVSMPPLADLPEIEESETVNLDDPQTETFENQSPSIQEQTPTAPVASPPEGIDL